MNTFFIEHIIENKNKYKKDYIYVRVEIIYNEIINDICNNCYKNHDEYSKYILEPYEYFISNNGIQSIINTKKLQIIDYNNNNNKILTCNEMSCSVLNINNFDDINISIIDDIFNCFINNKKIVKDFRKMCYNIFVKQLSGSIIFYDPGNSIVRLISYLLFILNKTNKYYDYNYKINKDNNIKIIEENKPLVVSLENDDKDILKSISNLEIKNIIIKNKIDKYNYRCNYDYKKTLDYIKVNDELIINNSVDKERMKIKLKDLDECEVMDLFISPNLLFNNFLKWCCIPYTKW